MISEHPNLTCTQCGGINFKPITREYDISYFCTACKVKYKRKPQKGSGQIAGPVYHRTQEL